MPTLFKDEKGNTVGKRVDMFTFKTWELRIRKENVGRHQQRSPEDYQRLRASVLRSGQRDPLIIQKDGLIPFIVDGAGRYEVICDLNKHELKDNPMEVLCVYKVGNEFDGIVTAIEQNAVRSGVQPIDDAFNIRALKKLNITDEEVAEVYFPNCLADKKKRAKALSWVKRREALLGLSPEAQKALADGKMEVTVAEHLSKLQAEQQKEALKKGGKVTSRDLNKAAGKKEKMTLAQAKEELDGVISEYRADKGVPKELLDLLQSLRDRM